MTSQIPPAPVPTGPVARRFEGKVAFITGAARGIGRAVAVRLAAEGADIIALDICENLTRTPYPASTWEDLEETARLVTELGRGVVTSKTDVRDFEGVKAAVDEGVRRFGRLDVVHANAGTAIPGPAWEIDQQRWDETIGVNLTGAFNTAKAAIPILIEQATGGVIVFTSSVAGLRGQPLLADYVAAKHGVTGLAKALALELARFRIRVNTLHPWAVATGINSGVTDLIRDDWDFQALFASSLPDGNSEAEDIAAAVAWLASDEARHVTGIQLPVDLGRTNR